MSRRVKTQATAWVCSFALLAVDAPSAAAQPYGVPAPASGAATGEYRTQATIAAERERQARAAQEQYSGAAVAPSTWDNRSSDTLNPSQRRKRSHTGDKVAGCVMGGILGGLLGAAVSNQQNRNTAIAAGAAAGCAAGFAFAANWSQRDRSELDAQTQDILARPGAQSEVWRAPESQQPVVITSSEPAIETQRVEFEHLDDVAPPTKGVQVISRPFRTTQVLRLRSTPDASTEDNIVGRFEAGEVVEVVGASADGKWAMVGYDGVIVGYAASDYLQQMDAQQTLRTVPTAKPKLQRPAPAPARVVASARTPMGDTSTARATAQPQIKAAAQPQVKKTKVLASTQCKSVVAATGQQSERKKGCAQPTGDWTFA